MLPRSAESVLDIFIFNTCILSWSLLPLYCLMSSDEAALEGQAEEHQFDPNARFRVTFQPEANSRIYLDVV